MLKSLSTTAFLSLFFSAAVAQEVPRVVLAEHFTNSFCSVCASRNPGFFQNLAANPDVLHISYYTSSPYPSCPINQYNSAAADARAFYYNVFGSTPRLAIEGASISASSNYSSPTIFSAAAGGTSPFTVSVTLTAISSTQAEARFVVRKVAASQLSTVFTYTALVQDTLFFNAANGENIHYNVFRNAIFSNDPAPMAAPTNVGDSTVQTQVFTLDANLPATRLYAIGTVHQQDGSLIQAARSSNFNPASASAIPSIATNSHLRVYPNPAHNTLQVEGNFSSTAIATILDMQGRKVFTQMVGNKATLPLTGLSAGSYFLQVTDGERVERIMFQKN